MTRPRRQLPGEAVHDVGSYFKGVASGDAQGCADVLLRLLPADRAAAVRLGERPGMHLRWTGRSLRVDLRFEDGVCTLGALDRLDQHAKRCLDTAAVRLQLPRGHEVGAGWARPHEA